MVIQYVATVFIALIIVQLILKVIKDRTALVRLIFWVIFWGGALILIWLPTEALDSFGSIFGVGRGVDVLIYLSIIILFYNNLRLNNRLEKIERNLTKIVRDLAEREIRA
jgi:small membrane protein